MFNILLKVLKKLLKTDSIKSEAPCLDSKTFDTSQIDELLLLSKVASASKYFKSWPRDSIDEVIYLYYSLKISYMLMNYDEFISIAAKNSQKINMSPKCQALVRTSLPSIYKFKNIDLYLYFLISIKGVVSFSEYTEIVQLISSVPEDKQAAYEKQLKIKNKWTIYSTAKLVSLGSYDLAIAKTIADFSDKKLMNNAYYPTMMELCFLKGDFKSSLRYFYLFAFYCNKELRINKKYYAERFLYLSSYLGHKKNIYAIRFLINRISNYKVEIYERKYYMAKCDLAKYYTTVNYAYGARSLKTAYPDVYLKCASEVNKGSTLLLFSIWGVGDELISFSRMGYMIEELALKNISISICIEPRLLKIYQRTYGYLYNKVTFIPCSRKTHIYTYLNHDESADEYLENQGFAYIMDLNVAKLLPSFNGLGITTSFISPHANKAPFKAKLDEGLVSEFHEKLKPWRDKFKVGISWRSSKNTLERSVHYTDIVNWDDIIKLHDNIVFFNLQYGDILEEMQEVKLKHGIDIINFDDLDYHDDFDSVLALIDNLDLVIAPCNAVVELAGLTNTKSIMTTTLKDSQWRFINNQDVVHGTMSFVAPKQLGNKKELLTRLKSRIYEEYKASEFS